MKFKIQIKVVETYVFMAEVSAETEEEALEKAEKFSDYHDITQHKGTYLDCETDIDLIDDPEVEGDDIDWWWTEGHADKASF